MSPSELLEFVVVVVLSRACFYRWSARPRGLSCCLCTVAPGSAPSAWRPLCSVTLGLAHTRHPGDSLRCADMGRVVAIAVQFSKALLRCFGSVLHMRDSKASPELWKFVHRIWGISSSGFLSGVPPHCLAHRSSFS